MIRKIFLLALLIVIGAVFPAYAQLYFPNQRQYNQYNQYAPPANSQLDAQLNYQDQMMVQQMAYINPPDARYEQFLNMISSKFNQAGGRVFQNYNSKDVRYVVLTGVFGFNAMALHRSIIIDSLLMDVMKRLAMGMAYYGKFNSDYTKTLASATLMTTGALKNRTANINTSNPENPFNLPSPPPLSQAQQQLAYKYFEELIAAVLAHEGSHAFLEHTKEKMLAQQALWRQGRGNQTQIQQYINQDFTKEKELEADRYGAKLLKYSGYSINGMVAWFRFADLLELYSGTLNHPNRTHPTGEQRIRQIKAAWGNF